MSRTRPAPRRVHHRDPGPGHTRRPCPCAHRSPRTVRLQPPSTPPWSGREAPNREVSNKKTKARARDGNHGARDPHATLINGLARTKVTRRRRNGTPTKISPTITAPPGPAPLIGRYSNPTHTPVDLGKLLEE